MNNSMSDKKDNMTNKPKATNKKNLLNMVNAINTKKKNKSKIANPKKGENTSTTTNEIMPKKKRGRPKKIKEPTPTPTPNPTPNPTENPTPTPKEESQGDDTPTPTQKEESQGDDTPIIDENDIKIPKASKSEIKWRKPKIILPYSGKIFENNCMSIRYNYGLHTQCVNKKPQDNEYCKTCLNNILKTKNKKPPHGDIRDRLKCENILDYVDPNNKKTIPYFKVLKRLKITKEEVIKEAKEFDIEIPEEHWIEAKTSEAKTTTPKNKKEKETPTPNPTPTPTHKESQGDDTPTPTPKEESQGDDTPTPTPKEESQGDDTPTPRKRGRPIEYEIKTISMTEEKHKINRLKTKLFKYNEINYLKSEDNCVYDIDTDDYIGVYKESKNTIEYF